MDNVQHKGTTRYNAKGMAKPVNFLCIAPEAQEVAIIGDFNNWESGKHLMNRQIDGSWSAQIDLHHGHHRYQFVIDGKPTLDRQLGQLHCLTTKKDAPQGASRNGFVAGESQPLAAS